jgi:zinc protease
MDANGSQRGKRPIFQLLPIKIGKYKLLEGEEYQPVITENFILIPQPEKIEKTEFRIVIKTI